MTMTLIGTVTVGAGGTTAVEFNSIPQTYSDLLVVVSFRTAFASVYQYIQCYFNDSTSGYTGKNFLFASSVLTNSTAQIDSGSVSANATSSTFSNTAIYIPDYKSANPKSFTVDGATENNSSAAAVGITNITWSTTSAITKISLTGAGQTIVQNSTASLYGILKGSGGATVS
jgi:hypothetical protein